MNEPRTPSRRPTMHDVAAAAGVSLKTVSRVVNDEGGVRPGLVAQVEQAIDELGYQRDDRARQLRIGAGRSKIIGFVQVDVANPFFSAIFRGIEDVAAAHGYQVIAGSSDGDVDQQDAVLRALIARRVDGIIIVPSGDHLDLLTAEMQRWTPVVFLDLEPPAHVVGDLVRSDHRGGTRIITRHLIDRGHTRIAFVGDDPGIFSAEERYVGFAEEMQAADLPVNQHWVRRDLSDPARSQTAVERLLRDHPSDSAPSALVTAQNFITVGAVRALHKLDLHNEVALVGFDDIDLADVVEPGITVMPQSPRELGSCASRLLFRRLDGHASGPVLTIPEDEIIVRGSGEIAPP